MVFTSWSDPLQNPNSQPAYLVINHCYQHPIPRNLSFYQNETNIQILITNVGDHEATCVCKSPATAAAEVDNSNFTTVINKPPSARQRKRENNRRVADAPPTELNTNTNNIAAASRCAHFSVQVNHRVNIWSIQLRRRFFYRHVHMLGKDRNLGIRNESAQAVSPACLQGFFLDCKLLRFEYYYDLNRG